MPTTGTMKTSSVAALMSAAVLSGCGSQGRFVRTDDTFHEKASSRDPHVFADHKPAQPYRAVGVVEATLDADASSDTIRAAIVPTARRVGCDVLVEWGLHQKVSIAPRAPDGTPMVLVHDGDSERVQPARQSVEGAPARPQRTYRYACGIFVAGSLANPIPS